MARIQCSERIDADLRRIVARGPAPAERDDGDECDDRGSAGVEMAAVTAAIDVLMASPLIGRPCEDGLRELVIGRRTRGCLALYHYDERMDLVRILAIRSHQDSGYSLT
ncbi:MAG: type II toxin-antitoxin system RelE/ParE family toxin [Xanthomonadales bacterium]|nr:type II toxin-antitoxin system RelE/ParE family toxin [Xanthomonadales bacterium]